MNRLLPLFISFAFLSGCYQTSLTPMMVAGPAAGAVQGKIVTSTVSTAFNYAVKERTGKFPYEHIIKKQKERNAKKVNTIENTVITASKEIQTKVGESSKNSTRNLYVSANKIRKITEETFDAIKPRYSYWSKQK